MCSSNNTQSHTCLKCEPPIVLLNHHIKNIVIIAVVQFVDRIINKYLGITYITIWWQKYTVK